MRRQRAAELEEQRRILAQRQREQAFRESAGAANLNNVNRGLPEGKVIPTPDDPTGLAGGFLFHEDPIRVQEGRMQSQPTKREPSKPKRLWLNTTGPRNAPITRRAIGRPIDRRVGRPFGQPYSTGRSTRRSIGRPIDRRIGQAIGGPLDRTVGRPIHRVVDRPVARPVHRSVDNKPRNPRL